MIAIKNIDHLNMNVSNLEKSKIFYQKVFGFRQFEEGVSSTSGNPYSIIGLPGRLFLCLYQSPAIEERTQKLNHFGIHVENFDEAIKVARENNLTLLYGGEIQYENSRSAYISDPDGNEIELAEYFGGGFQ